MSACSTAAILLLLVAAALAASHRREKEERSEKDESPIFVGHLKSLFGKEENREQTRSHGLTPHEEQGVVDHHNKLRLQEGGANIQKMRYNHQLAQLAQQWADACVWGHRPHFNPADHGINHAHVGENIAADSGSGDLIKATDSWYSEKSQYDYNSATCLQEPCGHYTQVVWADTVEIGCGRALCSPLSGTSMNPGWFVVCNYGPGGNEPNTKPFVAGDECTQCSNGRLYCNNGLCDSTCQQSGPDCVCKANCKNGSPTDNCGCKCNDGFDGPQCDRPCQDNDAQCGVEWPDFLCELYDMVMSKCPALCGRCVQSRRSHHHHHQESRSHGHHKRED